MNLSSDQHPITIVLFGRTGSGKSYLGNLFAGQYIFEEGSTLYSKTSSAKSYTTTLPGYPHLRIKIVDTPGFGDNRIEKSTEEFLADTINFLQKLGEGFHVGIYCISAKTRLDAHDIKEIQMIGALLGHEIFKHTLIAVTQANTLVSEKRDEIYAKFPIQLPGILSNHGLNDFGPHKVLFPDADSFQEKFLKSFTEIIKDAPFYQPKIAQEIITKDPESIKKFLAKPEMQAFMKQYEDILAEQKKQTEEMKVVMEHQVSMQKLLHEQSLHAQETYKRNIDSVNKELQEKKITNEKLEKDQKEQQEKLEQLKLMMVQQEQQIFICRNIIEEKERQQRHLEEKIRELQNIRGTSTRSGFTPYLLKFVESCLPLLTHFLPKPEPKPKL